MVKEKRIGTGKTSLLLLSLMLLGSFLTAAAQDRIKIELNMGQERPRHRRAGFQGREWRSANRAAEYGV